MSDVVTKAELKAEFALMEVRLTKLWAISVMIGLVTLFAVIVKLL
jgi:hypothetical protein